MSSYSTNLSQTTGTRISVLICVVSAALYVMSEEDSTARLFFALLAVICAVLAAAFYYIAGKYKADCVLSGSGTCSASLCGQGYWSAVNISKIAMFGGNCNASASVPCYGATLTCGMNACDIGAYDMYGSNLVYRRSNYGGNNKARWVNSSPISASSVPDLKIWAFYNASISACNVSYAVTIEALTHDLNKIIWNGSVLNLSTATTDTLMVRIPNVSFIPGYNIIEVDIQNNIKSGGVICDVIDANNNPIILSGAGTTMAPLTT